ncbi:MAG: hypothetical protein P4L65_09105 [Legionella sp.]|nr:hypothetical protein [Legionella sp.]
MMSLQELIRLIEADKGIGVFSKSHKTIGKGHTYTIPFALKPAQQVLAALGASKDPEHGNTDVTVSSFKPGTKSELVITRSRIDRLLKSAKIYVDTSKIPAGEYQKALASKTPLEHLPTGVCHSQEIDLLVDTVTSEHGRAHTTVRHGSITENAPAILLLSSAKLNLNDSHQKNKNNPLSLIKDMYRNLFQAALSEGRNYIAMPATGLGRSNGDPALYFAALMAAASEYPSLNIIYNPGKYSNEFDSALHDARKQCALLNVDRTSKNILFVAANLIQQEKPKLCAVHNPCNADAFYGLADVGGHWKSSSILGDLLLGEESRTFQTYIGTVTTAPLNRINPEADNKIVERNLDHPASAPTAIQVIEFDESSIDFSTMVSDPPVPALNSEDEFSENPFSAPPASPTHTNSPPLGFFPPEPELIEIQPEASTSSFDEEQLQEIGHTIKQLIKEIQSSWPYPNKDLKQIKVNALTALIVKSHTMSIPEAIAEVKKEYPRVVDGRLSTRTAQLFDKLELSASHSSSFAIV